MLDSDSNPGFFQSVAERLAAFANGKSSEERSTAAGTIDVCLLTLEDRVLYSAAPVPIDLLAQVDAIDASMADASANLFEPAEPLFNYHGSETNFVPTGFARDEVSESISHQLNLLDEFSTESVVESNFSDADRLEVEPADHDNAILNVESRTTSVKRELVVVDRGVEDYQKLVDDLVSSETNDRIFEIIYLDESSSGIETLTRELNDRVNRGDGQFDSLHLISHGSDGTIQLGTDRLGVDNLDQHSDAVASWGAALAIDADFLIYGCDVAQSDSGKEFVDSLASLTEADVAASDDITGHQSQGGDWEFEYIVGTTESDIAFSLTVLQNWEQSLANHAIVAESGGQAQAIGLDGAGRSTIVTSTYDDGVTDGFDIYIHTRDQFGNRTDDILVNETVAGEQVYASIAVAENGSKAVTWTSVSTTGERAVFAKFYDGGGSVVRGEFRVDVPSVGVEADDSSIAIDAAGNVVIVWESTESGVSEILGRRYSVDGSPVGGVFDVSGSGFADFEQSANPFVAMNDSGQFVVAWDTHNGSANDESDIFAKTFNADGTAFSSATQIQGQANFQYTQASAAIDSSGNFVVAYTANDLSGGADLDLRAESRLFDTSFVTSYSDFVTATDGDQFGSSVVLLDNGNVHIAWEGEGLTPFGFFDPQEVYEATVDFSTGTVLTPQQSLSVIRGDQAGAHRYEVSLTAVDDNSVAAFFLSQVLAEDGTNIRGEPASSNNETPSGSDRTFTLPEDGAQAISASDFGFSDADGGTFTQLQISRVPQHGKLLLNGTELTTGQVLLASEINSGELLYVPADDYSGQDNVLFFVNDGADYSDSFSTLIFEVLPEVDGLLLGFGTTYIPTSGGIPVNSSIEGEQSRSRIAATQDGGYVVVWESVDTDLAGDSDANGNHDDGQQIYLQRFDASNNKVGPEVLVGGNLEGDQTRPSVVTLADGTYVVAATTANDGGEIDVYAQRFDLSGNVLFADGTVDSTGAATIALAQHSQFAQDFVSLTALRGGGFLAAWSTIDPTLEPNASFATVARIFDADGNPGNEFLLNNADVSPDASGQFAPRTTELNNGSIVATWYDTSFDRMMYRVFDSAGVPVTESQPVSETTGTPEFNARIASLGDAGFVIIWRDGGATSADRDIVARRFELDGTPSADPIQVLSPNSSAHHSLPEVISLNDGGFIAVWNSVGSDNHSIGVAGARYDADLNPVTDTFVVNSRQHGAQLAPALTMLSNGELIVTYTSPDGDSSGVFVDRLSPAAVADEDTAVPLNLDFSNIDSDGSEFVDDIQLSGMPAGTRVSDGVTTINITGFSHVVHVTGDGLQVENLTVTPPENFYGDIRLGVTYVTRDSNGTSTASGPYQTTIMTIRVNPVNDVATYDPIAAIVEENGTTNLDLDTLLPLGNDPDNAGIYTSATPIASYDLSVPDSVVASGGGLEWTSTLGAAGAISFDAADAQFNANPTTDYPGIRAAIDLDGSGGGDLSIDGAKALEIWFRPNVADAHQTLIEFGDANSGWGLYQIDGQVELHFRTPDAPSHVSPLVLSGGQLSSSEFNQVVVSFSTDGDLAGNTTQPDVALYVNGERVDLLTDLQGIGDLSLLTGALNGSLGATHGGFLHADAVSYDNFTGSIAQVNAYDESFTTNQVQNRFFEVAHGAHIVQVDGNDVEVGVATELSSGALVTYNSNGTITYDPNGKFERLDAFDLGNEDSYQRDDFDIAVSDGQGDTQTLTVQLTVQGENDAPTLSISLADPAPTTGSAAGSVVAIAEGVDIDTNGDLGLTYSLTGTVTGAFAIDPNTGEISISDEAIYQNPPGGSHEVTVTVRDLAGGTSEVSYPIPVINIPTGQVTGTVYEDAIGDGSVTGDAGVDGVTVHLYRDNGDGVRDTNDIFVATAVTAGGGNYVFQGSEITHDNYFVVVDSTNITSSNGFNGSYGVSDVWAEQTYASAGGLYLNGAGVEIVSTGGALFGGYSGTRSDDASTLAGAEHVSEVTVSGTSDGVADFGFSFNVVTNTLAGDDQDDNASSAGRTVQGSLRQFIQNANAIDNSDPTDVDNAMRFVARNDANSADSTWWSIVVSEALPAIVDSNTTIDGTVYAADGSGVLDLRTGLSGTVTSVGANDSHSLTGFDQPELEIVADQTVPAGDRVLNGLVFAASAEQTTLSDVVVRNLSIHGFGSTDGEGSDIYLAGGGVDGASDYWIENALIEDTFVGVAPDGSHGTVFRSHGIKIYRANDGTVQDSLIGSHGLNGIHFVPAASDANSSLATGWQILRNEISQNGTVDVEFGGIGLGNSSDILLRHNLIADNEGFGIDSFFAPGGFTILENTITRNGLGGFEQGGIRLFGDDSVVSENRIIDNVGAGVSVVGTTEQGSSFRFAGTGNELTQNQFGGNTSVDVDLLSSPSRGRSFSDITVGATPVLGLDTNGNGSLSASEIAGTGFTLADHDTNGSGTISRSEYDDAQALLAGQGDGDSSIDGLNEHSGNQGLDEPVLTNATLYSDRAELEFQLAAGVDRVELYEVTTVGGEERVTYVTTLLVSDMTFDPRSGAYQAILPSAPAATTQFTALAFDGANTSEFGNRLTLNSAPSAESNTVSATEDMAKNLDVANFGFNDLEDGTNPLLGTIRVATVSGGTLSLNGVDVTLPATLSRGEVDNLVFTPTQDSTTDGLIEFTVADSDGASDGTTYQLTVEVSAENDLPTAESNTVATLEDTPLPLGQDDFGFTDVEDQADESLGRATVTSVTGGTLRFSGVEVSLPAEFSRNDLDSLVFVPTVNSTLDGVIEFTVADSDGASNGITYELTVLVAAENDAPSAESNTINTNEDVPRSLSQDDFGFTDVEDQGDESLGMVSVISVTEGVLQLNGLDVVLPVSLSRSDLDNLVFVPTQDSTSDGVIEFTVTDSVGASDGTTYQLTVLVAAVNDAPELDIADTNITIDENTPFELVLNAVDTEDETATWEIVREAAQQSLFVNDDGTLRLATLPDFENPLDANGDNTFSVTIVAVDSEGLQSDKHVITVKIDDVNEAPIATSEPVLADVQVSDGPSDVPINLNDLVSDVDAGDSITFSLLDQADQGFVTIDEAGNVFFELTDLAGRGQDSFQFIATDTGGLQSEIVTVDLNVINGLAIPGSGDPDRDEFGDDNDSNNGDDDSQDGDTVASTAPRTNVEDEDSLTGDLPTLVSDGVVSSSVNQVEFNDFDDDETTVIESDNLSSGAVRTYSYAFNLEEIDLLNQLSEDKNMRRSAQGIQFDANILASAFLEELDSSKRHFIRERLAIGSPEVAVSAASLLTVGYLVWNLGSGLLVSTFLSSLPTWSALDVLPVISKSAIDDEDDESIEQIVDA
jgi:hypothetical protein